MGEVVDGSATASDWLRPRLGHAWRDGRVVGATSRAAYVAIEPPLGHDRPRAPADGARPLGHDRSPGARRRLGADVPVLALEGPGAVGLPNGIVLADHGVVERVRSGDPVTIDRRGVVGPGWSLRITRWRRSRPVPGPADPATVRARLAACGASPARPHPAAWPDADPRLVAGAAALVDLSTDRAGSAPGQEVGVLDGLLGYGPGSTPSGDDVLAGFLATTTVLAGAWDRPGTPGRLAALVEQVRRRAGTATTALSATLLDCAVDGAMARPAAAVLDTLTAGAAPGGRLAARLDDLARVGHSSGRDLTLGIVAATLHLTAPGPRSTLRAGAGPSGSRSDPHPLDTHATPVARSGCATVRIPHASAPARGRSPGTRATARS